MVKLLRWRTSRKPALLVVFMCNHCPYVKHIQHGLAQLGPGLPAQGVAIVGINSNDAANYPDDSSGENGRRG